MQQTAEEQKRLYEEMVRNIAWAYRMDDKGNIIFVNQPPKAK